MKRVLSKIGAYTSHLATLSEDRFVKAADRAKLTSYCKKWVNAKYILGCALFVDLLTPCTTFSKSMQSDEVHILGALTCLLKTLKETENSVPSLLTNGLLTLLPLKSALKRWQQNVPVPGIEAIFRGSESLFASLRGLLWQSESMHQISPVLVRS